MLFNRYDGKTPIRKLSRYDVAHCGIAGVSSQDVAAGLETTQNHKTQP